MCGEHVSAGLKTVSSGGSSPHVRGARWHGHVDLVPVGIIPACAGSTTCCRPVWCSSRDHPRMCGEHAHVVDPHTAPLGSSPHVRGAPDSGFDVAVESGIIPACAGSTRKRARIGLSCRDHPRMCGEHLREIGSETPQMGSSPHVRGAPRRFMHLPFFAGIIPACAGSTISIVVRSRLTRDHPRMCGEHASKIA